MATELCVRLVPLFQGLSSQDQQEVEQLVHHRKFQKGELIISPDDHQQLVIVHQGTAKLYQLNVNGQEQMLRTFSTGEYVGETWLLGITNTSNFVEAITDCDVCILDRPDFLQLLQVNSDIAIKLLEGQASRIAGLRRQNQLISLPSIDERLLAYLNQLATKQGSSQIHLPVKLKDLATYLATTPETLSRQLTKLEQAGIIKRHLRDIQILRAINRSNCNKF